MSLLPYQRIKIRTRLSSQEALKRLANAVQSNRPWGAFQRGTKPYEGKVEGSQFEMLRTITYRNPGQPIMKGHIDREANGCSIYVTMRLQDLSLAFIILFALILAAFVCVAYIFEASDPSTTGSSLMFFVGAYALLYVIVTAGFSFEADKSKEFFRELFEAEAVEELRSSKPSKAAG